jgi:predicted MFS family arabinose efflux permease
MEDVRLAASPACSLNNGYSVEMSTVIILLFGVGGGVGVLAGGAAGQLLYNWCVQACRFGSLDVSCDSWS